MKWFVVQRLEIQRVGALNVELLQGMSDFANSFGTGTAEGLDEGLPDSFQVPIKQEKMAFGFGTDDSKFQVDCFGQFVTYLSLHLQDIQ